GGVVLAVGRVQFFEAVDDRLQSGVGGGVEDQRADLGAQEVVGAGGAERGQVEQFLRGQEVEHGLLVGEVPDLAAVGGGQAPDHGGQGGGAFGSGGVVERGAFGDGGAEGVLAAALGDERFAAADDLQ